jgi:hypothetical protein
VIRRPILLSAALIVLTMIAGLAVRFTHLGLPAFVVKYGGSALWAMMIYWVGSSVLPDLPIPRAAVIAGVIATLVEFLKLVHTPALEAFRRTLAGVLLLGRVFSRWDIGVYWVAIAIAAMLDRRLRRTQ